MLFKRKDGRLHGLERGSGVHEGVGVRPDHDVDWDWDWDGVIFDAEELQGREEGCGAADGGVGAEFDAGGAGGGGDEGGGGVETGDFEEGAHCGWEVGGKWMGNWRA